MASAEHGEHQTTGKYTSKRAILWWEEDFFSGKVVPFPGAESNEFGACAPSVDTECIRLASAIGKDLECVLQAGDSLKGFHLSSVPSLTNLCLNVILSACSDPEKLMPQLPPGLVSLLRRREERISLKKIQLKWLLTDLRQRESYLNFYLEQSIDGRKVFLRGCRPVWDTDLTGRQHLYRHYTFVEYHSESCSLLPVAVEGWEDGSWCIAATAHAIQLMLPHRLALGESSVNVCESLTARLQAALVAALARVKHALMRVSPMLVEYVFEPALAYMWWSRGDLSKAREMFLQLSDRMPNSPDGIPLEYATEPIETLGCQKALYLNEIARLHMYCNQPEKACDLYRRAGDVCASMYPSRARDCREQSLLLMASAYDQGQMSNDLASRAAAAWDRIILDPECRPNVVQRAAESFLHCHCGYLTTETKEMHKSNTAWLREAKACLTELSAKAPQVSLHLSLILALLGETNAAENAYMNYVDLYASQNSALLQRIPGAISVFIGSDIKPHPWWVLSEWLAGEKKSKQSHREVNALPLQWRRQLRHCSCDIREVDGEYIDSGYWSKPYLSTADVQDDKLFLHLTKRGLLTGCMSQHLPCLKQVLLDPLTGCVCPAEEFSGDENLPWSNYQVVHGGYDVIKFNFTFDTSLPTPVRIFQNSGSGVTVSFLTWHDKKTVKERMTFHQALDQEKQFVGDVLLNYSGLDGSHELSLTEAIIRAKREKIVKQLISQGYDADPGVMEDASDFLDYCIRNSLQMQFSHVKAALDRESRPRNLLQDIKQHLGKKPSSYVNKTPLTGKERRRLSRAIACYGKYQPEARVLVLQNVLHFGESTVVLAFYTAVCTGMSSNDIDTLVFIDCSSRGTFVNPVVHLPDQPDALWRLSTENPGWPGGKPGIFTAVEYLTHGTESKQNKDTLVIFGTRGEIVQAFEIWSSERPTVVANKSNIPDNDPDYTDMVLHTNKTLSRLRLMSTNGAVQFQTPPLGTIEHYVVVCSMVFVTLRDRILILDSTTLTPVQIQHHTSQPASGHHLLPSQTSDGVLLTGERSFMKVLSVSEVSSVDKDVHIQVILGVANRVLVLHRSVHSQNSSEKPASSPVLVRGNIKVPGVPTEACYITQLDGFVITVSIFENPGIPLYRENLYWLDMLGTIKGIHPFVGPGPHCLFAAQLGASSSGANVEEDESTSPKSEKSLAVQVDDGSSEKHWYLYFADGLGALCCIKLQDLV